MGSDGAVICDVGVGFDDGEGADLYVLANFCRGVDDCGVVYHLCISLRR